MLKLALEPLDMFEEGLCGKECALRVTIACRRYQEDSRRNSQKEDWTLNYTVANTMSIMKQDARAVAEVHLVAFSSLHASND